MTMTIIRDWMIHWDQWQSERVGWGLLLSLPFSPPLPIPHSPLFMEHCSIYGGFIPVRSPQGTLHPSPSELPAALRHKTGFKKNDGKGMWPSRPSIGGKWRQMLTLYDAQPDVHKREMTRDSPRLCVSPVTTELRGGKTDCRLALALQWRMKVHGARQTGIPLQQPLSNKHIY